jgi:hypothetical protein
MAVGVGEVQLTITTRIPLEGGRAIYLGTAAAGTEYPTGGATIGQEETNKVPTTGRFTAPERWDYLRVDTAVASAFVGPNKLKLFTVEGAEAPGAEFASKHTMATAIPAGTTFFGIGLS